MSENEDGLPSGAGSDRPSCSDCDLSIWHFVVRLWLEAQDEAATVFTWRGQVTHVPSGRRIYVNQLDDVQTAINSFLRMDGKGA